VGFDVVEVLAGTFTARGGGVVLIGTLIIVLAGVVLAPGLIGTLTTGLACGGTGFDAFTIGLVVCGGTVVFC
jgi:hypothetical protein